MLQSRENAKRHRKPSEARSFWWLELGRERCAACGQTYVYETGYYCVACDGGLCSICVEEAITTGVFCVQCKDAAKD